MKTQKFRVFRFAQKRGIPFTAVRKVLSALGAPPSLSQVPVKRITNKQYNAHLDAYITVSSRHGGDKRDINRDTANKAIDVLKNL